MENDLIQRINKLEDRAFQLRMAISGLCGTVTAMADFTKDEIAKEDFNIVKVKLEEAVELFD